MCFAVIEIMTFGLDGWIHAIIMFRRSHGVFNIPTFKSDVFMSDRADLYKDRSSIIHGRCCLVVHVTEVRLLVSGGRYRPLQSRYFSYRLRLDDHDVGTGGVTIDISGNLYPILVKDQFAYIIIISSFQRMSFPFVEIVAKGFCDRFFHRIVVVCRRCGVFDGPAVVIYVVKLYRSDLDVNGGSNHHRSGRVVLHIVEFEYLRSCFRD